MRALDSRRAAAALTATAVAAAAAIGLSAAPAQAQPGEFPIVDGTVTWGVKESFRNYIGGPIANGDITAVDGAARDDAGLFTFPVTGGTYDLGTHDTESDAVGGVHFFGHGGELDLTFANPRVTTDHAAETGVLHLDVTEAGTVTEDVAFADLDLSGRDWERGEYTTISDVPATLTAAGGEAFAGFYGEGTELDPVTIAIKAEAGPGEDTTSPDDATTAPAEEEEEEPVEGVLDIMDGRADWGVKESFRSYVTGPIASGQIEAADGASENPDGTFRFANATGAFDTDTGVLEAAFEGTVRFSGHAGELALDVADVSVRGTGDDLSLYVGDTALADLAAVDLAVSDGGLAVSGAAATLTAAGADFFAGDVHGSPTRFYEAGEALDPVSFALAFDDDVDLDGLRPGGDGGGEPAPGAGAPKLPTTGSPLVVVLAAAGALLAGGVTVMVLARRRAVAA